MYEGERIALVGPNGAGKTTFMLHFNPKSRTELIGIIKNFAYIPNYLQLAKTEYQGSPLKPGDLVLFLGSGPLPISLIYEKGLRRLLDTFSRYDLPEPFVEYLQIAPKPPVNNTVVFLTTNNIK